MAKKNFLDCMSMNEKFTHRPVQHSIVISSEHIKAMLLTGIIWVSIILATTSVFSANKCGEMLRTIEHSLFNKVTKQLQAIG